jgi:hypothetical protein
VPFHRFRQSVGNHTSALKSTVSMSLWHKFTVYRGSNSLFPGFLFVDIDVSCEIQPTPVSTCSHSLFWYKQSQWLNLGTPNMTKQEMWRMHSVKVPLLSRLRPSAELKLIHLTMSAPAQRQLDPVVAAVLDKHEDEKTKQGLDSDDDEALFEELEKDDDLSGLREKRMQELHEECVYLVYCIPLQHVNI